MKILVLAPQLPYPPRQGAAMRNWGILRELSQRHEVHLLCFGDTDEVATPAIASVTLVPSPSRHIVGRLKDLLTTSEPDMARRLRSRAFGNALARLLEAHDFDVVQVEGIEMVPFAVPHMGRSAAPLWVYDAHNAETDLQQSALRADLQRPARWHAAAYSALQVLKLRQYEARHLSRFGLVVAVSDEDSRLLRSIGGVRTLVVPNGIDSTLHAPGSAPPADELARCPGAQLVFTGKMDFRPNVDGVLWFVDDILPRLTEQAPAPTLWIVGQQPHASLERLRDHPQVRMTGFVEQVEPYLAAADVVVVPLRMGSGTRLKVLQALSLARPVVGTTLGCAGLGLIDGKHVRLADSAPSFAAALDALLRDPEQARELGAAGREHVRDNFDWRVLVPRLEEAYSRSLVESGGHA